MIRAVEIVAAWCWQNVFGNLVASAICFIAGAVWAHRKWVRPLHAKLDAIHQHVKTINPQTETIGTVDGKGDS